MRWVVSYHHSKECIYFVVRMQGGCDMHLIWQQEFLFTPVESPNVYFFLGFCLFDCWITLFILIYGYLITSHPVLFHGSSLDCMLISNVYLPPLEYNLLISTQSQIWKPASSSLCWRTVCTKWQKWAILKKRDDRYCWNSWDYWRWQYFNLMGVVNDELMMWKSSRMILLSFTMWANMEMVERQWEMCGTVNSN